MADSTRERERFEVQDAPRGVPAGVRYQLLFGGVVGLVGWMFVTVGLPVVFLFIGNSEILNVVTFAGERGRVQAEVVAVEATNSYQDDEPIYRVTYRYEVDGTAYRGASYGLTAYLDAGEEVSVEYLVDSPERSRIEGMRRYRLPSWMAFVVIFPLVGLGLVVHTLRKGRKAIWILVHGVPVMGTFAGKRETNVRINERPVYEVEFEFVDRDGHERTGTIRTANLASVEDDPRERLFYDPRSPSAIVLVDSLPGSVEIDPEGHLTGSPAGVFCVFLPALAFIAGVVGWILS